MILLPAAANPPATERLSASVTVSLSPSEKQKLKDQAVAAGVSMSALARRRITNP